MSKKILFLFIFTMFCQSVFASDIAVEIVPDKLYSTSTFKLQEGDTIEFRINKNVYVNSNLYLKKGEKVNGILISREENDFADITAKLYIDQFETKNVHNKAVKLYGIIYKEGNDHKNIMDVLYFDFIRGGEAFLNPKKDKFILYLKV